MPKILVVDDNRAILELTARALSHAGFDVVLAQNGSDGLRLAAETSFDAVVLDFVMPGMDGLEFLHHLRAITRTPVVVWTAHEQTEEERMRIARTSAVTIIRANELGVNTVIAELRRLLGE